VCAFVPQKPPETLPQGTVCKFSAGDKVRYIANRQMAVIGNVDQKRLHLRLDRHGLSAALSRDGGVAGRLTGGSRPDASAGATADRSATGAVA
jgi:hypothetical protein